MTVVHLHIAHRGVADVGHLQPGRTQILDDVGQQPGMIRPHRLLLDPEGLALVPDGQSPAVGVVPAVAVEFQQVGDEIALVLRAESDKLTHAIASWQ